MPIAERHRGRTGRRWLAGVLAVVGATAGLAVPAAPAPAAPRCAPAGGRVTTEPWAQQLLDPERLRPFSQGAGVTVAVLGSGVDAAHPQLRDRVEPGYDAVRSGGRADTDCTGAGTRVAGLMVARRAQDTAFAGLAPNARVLPVRVRADEARDDEPTDPRVLARGISWAVEQRARVVAVTVAATDDDPALRAAVARAVARGAVVVAAAGDRGDDGNPQSYPASYPDVLAVGAIGPDGRRWPRSQYGPWLDLVAPGVAVTTTERGSGLVEAADGTALACGFVAGSLALTMAKRADAPADELIRLLTATAVGGADPAEYGHGTVNPYDALNDRLVPAARPTPLPAFVPAQPHVDTVAAASRRTALVGALAAVAGVLVVAVLALALPRARRRHWRAAVTARPAGRAEPGEPGPPVELFQEGTPTPSR